jgi:hypothetical protein
MNCEDLQFHQMSGYLRNNYQHNIYDGCKQYDYRQYKTKSRAVIQYENR